jgi:hypothetical protein
MRVNLPQYAVNRMDIESGVAWLMVKNCVVVKNVAIENVVGEKKVLDGHSQWFSHVR